MTEAYNVTPVQEAVELLIPHLDQAVAAMRAERLLWATRFKGKQQWTMRGDEEIELLPADRRLAHLRFMDLKDTSTTAAAIGQITTVQMRAAKKPVARKPRKVNV